MPKYKRIVEILRSSTTNGRVSKSDY